MSRATSADGVASHAPSGPLAGEPFDVPLALLTGVVSAGDLVPAFEAIEGVSSAANLQPWRFWLLDPRQKAIVAGHAQDALGRSRPNHRNDAMAAAPALVLAAMDVGRAKCRFGVRGAELFGVQDVAVATHALRRAAWAIGLTSHWVREVDLAAAQEDLALTPRVRAQALVAFGRVGDGPVERPPSLRWRDVVALPEGEA